MEAVKKCTKCGELKPLGHYHKDKRRKDGRSSGCKVCLNSQKIEYNREYRKTRRAYISQQRKEYFSRPEVKLAKREYRTAYESDPEVKDSIRRTKQAYNSRPEVKNAINERSKKYRYELRDYYIRNAISAATGRILIASDIPPELIELKRQSILLKRTIKQQNEQD